MDSDLTKDVRWMQEEEPRWKDTSLEAAIQRVQTMERCFDTLCQQAREDVASLDRDLLQRLVDYYESPDWRCDYERDEQGLLPSDLKRGVLSQDGVYQFLQSLSENDEAHGALKDFC